MGSKPSAKPFICKYLEHFYIFSFCLENARFLDRVGENLLGIGGSQEMLQKVKTSLRKIEALPIQERLHLQITLAILILANPNPKQINKLANKLNIPLLGFQTFDELVSYLEAVIRSGTSEEEKNGTVFFMGNTEQHLVLRFEKYLIQIGPLPGRPRDRGPKTLNIFF